MEAFHPPERLETGRLTMRRPRPEDALAILEGWAGDADAVRYLTWTPHRALCDTEDFLCRCDEDWREGASFPFVICDRGGDRPFGMIHLRACAHAVSYGYVLGRPRWNRGLASEALSAWVDWSLDRPGIRRAWAFCDAQNIASSRVMEKAGMRFEGVARRYRVHPNVSPEPRDAMIYARTR